jgi:hypothetical protein
MGSISAGWDAGQKRLHGFDLVRSWDASGCSSLSPSLFSWAIKYYSNSRVGKVFKGVSEGQKNQSSQSVMKALVDPDEAQINIILRTSPPWNNLRMKGILGSGLKIASCTNSLDYIKWGYKHCAFSWNYLTAT